MSPELLKRTHIASASKTFLQRLGLFADPRTVWSTLSRPFLPPSGRDREFMRPDFVKFAESELPNWRIFLAEKVFDALISEEGAAHHDLAEIEELLGAVVNAIVIFPESPGSYAELGYFSKSSELAKKSLVISNIKLQSEDSFISLGPIHLIDKTSIYKYAIQMEYGVGADFKQITDRLNARTPKVRKRLEAKSYSTLSPQIQLFIVFELIRLFHALTVDGLQFAFKSIFGHANEGNLKRLLSILVNVGFVSRRDSDSQYFYATPGESSLIEFEGVDDVELRLEMLDFYEKAAPEIAAFVKELPK